MKQLIATAVALLSVVFATTASANLAIGDRAPDFSAQGAQGPTPMTIHLSDLLKKGPVVLFFFPSVFVGSSGEECHEFADNIDNFRAAGVTVIGMSRDSTDALSRFSTDECAGKIPMASADINIVTGFDVNDSANFTTRTTYVINSGGIIVFAADGDIDSNHVQHALAFVQGMKK